MSTPAKTKQEVLCEFRCNEILDAARHVFSKRGFELTTMDDIASAAGVAKGTIYLYFKSKRDIYFEALRRGIAALYEKTNLNMAARKTAPDKIRAFIATRVEYLEENREFFRIYYSEFANHFVPLSPLPKGFREQYLRQAKVLEGLIADAVSEGSIRPVEPYSTALRLYDMTLGLIAQRMLGWSRATAEEDVDALFSLLWKGIGA